MSVTNLQMKMVNIMSRVDSVLKGATVSTGKNSKAYKAVKHDDVAALIHPELVKEKIWCKVSVDDCDLVRNEREMKDAEGTYYKVDYLARVWVTVTFINAENPTDREECKSFAYAIDSGDKAVGKAESMATKYVYLKNFTLESTDEEEQRDDEEEKPRHAGGQEFPMTEAQRAFIIRLCKEKNVPLPATQLSKQQAGDLIKKLTGA
jgi:hypothetical protein